MQSYAEYTRIEHNQFKYPLPMILKALQLWMYVILHKKNQHTT